ncbi:MAG: extracellular solute-binding protein [Actinomycetota bacterium]|nr:extracellular solute-binding protein [Actinomycetota bacterium]
MHLSRKDRITRRVSAGAITVLALSLAGSASAASLGGSSASQARRVSVLGPWTGADERSFRAVLDEFEAGAPATTAATYESAGEMFGEALLKAIAAGKGPDVAILPNPLLLKRFATRRELRPLAFARSTVAANYAPVWLQVGSVRGNLYGVVFQASNKSTIWYDVKAFRGAGLKTPATFNELLRSARALRAWGTRAYAIAGADGWTLADLFENVYLRQAGAKRYDLLAEHKLRWTDPSVKAALRTMAKILGDRTNIPGGTSGALETDLAQSVSQVFADPPKAAMVIEGDFVAPLITASTNAQPGTDFDVFSFPSIGKSGRVVVGGTDTAIVVLLRSTPASRSLVSYLATARAASVWVKRGDFTSPNRRVGSKLYADAIRQRTATALARAQVFRWDLSELQPAAFGATASQGLPKLFQDFLRNPSSVNGTAAALERAATRAYGK